MVRHDRVQKTNNPVASAKLEPAGLLEPLAGAAHVNPTFLSDQVQVLLPGDPPHVSLMSLVMDDRSDESTHSSFRSINSNSEHGVGHEILCSLPRSIACRLCQVEKDCPYLVDRSPGRLVVHRREPVDLVVRDLVYVSTGSKNSPNHSTPFLHHVLALLAWLSVPLLIFWVVFVHQPGLLDLVYPALAMLATFLFTITGVPIVRRLWRNHGGRHRTKPWPPS